MLYLPETCHSKGIKRINPKNAYAKKRDAENHVALLCIRKLHEKGFLTDYLFVNTEHELLKGCIGSQQVLKPAGPISTKMSMFSDTMSQHSSLQPQNFVPRKQKQTTSEQREKRH